MADRVDELVRETVIKWYGGLPTPSDPAASLIPLIATALREHAREERARAIEECAQVIFTPSCGRIEMAYASERIRRLGEA